MWSEAKRTRNQFLNFNLVWISKRMRRNNLSMRKKQISSQPTPTTWNHWVFNIISDKFVRRIVFTLICLVIIGVHQRNINYDEGKCEAAKKIVLKWDDDEERLMNKRKLLCLRYSLFQTNFSSLRQQRLKLFCCLVKCRIKIICVKQNTREKREANNRRNRIVLCFLHENRGNV